MKQALAPGARDVANGARRVGSRETRIDIPAALLHLQAAMYAAVTDVEGIEAGQVQDFKAGTGCTVVLARGGAVRREG